MLESSGAGYSHLHLHPRQLFRDDELSWRRLEASRKRYIYGSCILPLLQFPYQLCSLDFVSLSYVSCIFEGSPTNYTARILRGSILSTNCVRHTVSSYVLVTSDDLTRTPFPSLRASRGLPQRGITLTPLHTSRRFSAPRRAREGKSVRLLPSTNDPVPVGPAGGSAADGVSLRK